MREVLERYCALYVSQLEDRDVAAPQQCDYVAAIPLKSVRDVIEALDTSRAPSPRGGLHSLIYQAGGPRLCRHLHNLFVCVPYNETPRRWKYATSSLLSELDGPQNP